MTDPVSPQGPSGVAALIRESEHTRTVALLHEVWKAVHERRFDKDPGASQTLSPNTYYAGVRAAEEAVLRVAARDEISEQEVYRG